ncbi:MAG: hypothetical protein NUK65_05580, partial [Firmicutes bacterium]|nr:hypothetical protein [Bacillota bacterium]
RTTKTRVLTDIRYHVGKMQHNIEPITIHKKIEPWRQQILNPEELTSIENSFSQTDLPPDLASSMKALFVAQRKRLSWVIKQGEPVCEVCGLPLVKTAKETYCLSCKTEDNG